MSITFATEESLTFENIFASSCALKNSGNIKSNLVQCFIIIYIYIFCTPHIAKVLTPYLQSDIFSATNCGIHHAHGTSISLLFTTLTLFWENVFHHCCLSYYRIKVSLWQRSIPTEGFCRYKHWLYSLQNDSLRHVAMIYFITYVPHEFHDDLMIWQRYPYRWPLLCVNSTVSDFPTKAQWCGALMISLMLAKTSSWKAVELPVVWGTVTVMLSNCTGNKIMLTSQKQTLGRRHYYDKFCYQDDYDKDIRYHWPLLLTWFNFNPSMDK